MKKLIFLAVLFFVSPAWAQGSVEEKSKTLEKYQEQLTEHKKRLNRLSRRETTLQGELRQITEKRERLSVEISGFRVETNHLADRIDKTRKRIRQLRSEMHRRESNVADRLRDLYVWGTPSYLEILLAAKTPADFRQRGYFIRQWIDQDRELISSFKQLADSLTQKKIQLETDRRTREDLLTKLNRREGELAEEKKAQGQLLTVVRTQSNFYRQSITELEQAAKDLGKLIETLRRRESEKTSLFAQMRGKLPWPARGKIERGFGRFWDKRLRVAMHHKGVDLRVRTGAPVTAVFDGVVAYSGWFQGYGRILIIDHGGDYFTLYAHMSKLFKKEGDSVVTGEQVAEVGDTGSLKGFYLYFELRYKGVSQDPVPWFAARGKR